MSVLSILRSSATVAVTVVVVLAGATAATAAPAVTEPTDPTVAQPFAAESGDRCRYGTVEGALAWRFSRPPVYPQVDVRGVLVDNPAPSPIIDRNCTDDGFYSYVRFTAYTGRTVLDEQVVRVDNAALRFGLTLGQPTSVTHVDRVTVGVCRVALRFPERFYCGPVNDYFPHPISR
jgi:hypothetical protein